MNNFTSKINLSVFIISLLLMGNSFDLLATIPGIWGDGSEWNPYLIGKENSTTPLQKLNKIAKWVNKDTSGTDGWDGTWTSVGKHFWLVFDITGFTSTIGNMSSPFMGTFHGQNRRIDVNIHKVGDADVGLFGSAKNAIITNLTVSGTVVGASGVGGVLGYGQDVWIENCTNVANVTAKALSIAPIDPFPPDIITHSISFYPNNGLYAGGIVGVSALYNGVTIIKCANAGHITGADAVGGIIGSGCSDSEILRCINIGTVRGKHAVGGIVGSCANSVKHCLNAGFVVGNSTVGGIIADCGALIYCTVVEYCLNTGVVHGNQSTGSIAGWMSNTNNATNNFYDKQMSSKGGIDGSDIANKAVGKETFELTGNNLSVWGGTQWRMNMDTPADKLYPTPKDAGNIYYTSGGDFDYYNDHLEHAAAATLKLQVSPVFETADNIQDNVFFTHTWANVYWTSKLENVHIFGSNPPIFSSHQDNAPWDARGAIRRDTMIASCHAYSKQVPIYIPVAIYKTAAETDYATNVFSIGEVTPNIVTDNATIDIQAATEGNLNVSIYDLAGTKVANIADRYVEANISLQVDLNNLSNLSTGSYMAVVSVGNEVVMRKFIKQ